MARESYHDFMGRKMKEFRKDANNHKRQNLLVAHEAMCAKARNLMAKKNMDYAGEEDIFANFRRTEDMGITTTEKGFLVRMTDKFSRLATFTENNELAVKDESVEDTLIDIINYAVLFHQYIKTKKDENEK